MNVQQPLCPNILDGYECILIEDENHWNRYDHSPLFQAYQPGPHPLFQHYPQPHYSQAPIQKPLCTNYDNCPNTYDDAHVRQFFHQCKYNESCRHKFKPEHNNRFLHNGDPCWHLVIEASKNKLVNPPQAPTVLFGLNKLSNLEVGQLINPIKEWFLSRSPVTYNGKSYECRGLKCSSATAETQEVVLFDAAANTWIVVNKTAITQPPTRLSFPWHGLQKVVIYKSVDFTQRLQNVLLRQLGGTQYTAHAVLQFLLTSQTVYLVGGVIRDVLHRQEHNVKDIDIAFSHSSSHIAALVAGQYPVSAHTTFGRIQFGTAQGIFLEGKTFNGFNNDRDANLQVHPKCMSVDLEADLLCRDFTCNTLWYDLVNHVIIDPTGDGLQDLHNKQLRIPVAQNQWDTWAQGNPTKLLRYVKLVLTNYTPVDTVTEQFIIGKLRSGLVSKTDWTNFCSYNRGLDLKGKIMQLLNCNGQGTNGCRCPACVHK